MASMRTSDSRTDASSSSQLLGERQDSQVIDQVSLKGCCDSDNLRALWGLFILNTLFSLCQMLAAVIANSLSMLSDSGSMLVDSVAYVANIYLERRKHIMGCKATKLWEVITSIVSVGLLVIVTIFAIADASKRLKHKDEEDPQDVDGRLVFAFATANFALDVVMCFNYFFQLRHRRQQNSIRDQVMSEAKEELNMMSAFVHLFADTLRSVTSMIAGVLEQRFPEDAVKIDAIAAFIVCGAILLAASFVFYEAYLQYLDYLAHKDETGECQEIVPACQDGYVQLNMEA